MDPNALLEEILTHARITIEEYDSTLDTSEKEDEAADIAEEILNLDEWITKGGFLPKRWNP